MGEKTRVKCWQKSMQRLWKKKNSKKKRGKKAIAKLKPGYERLLDDEEVELIRDIHEDGFIGYLKIARAFNVSKSTIRDICTYRRRTGIKEKHDDY